MTDTAHTSAEDRIARERRFFDDYFAHAELRSATDKFYAAGQGAYRAYARLLADNCPGKRVLEYGCGPGSYAPLVAQLGGNVQGIDISPVAIEQAKRYAADAGLPIEYSVMNAEATTFDDSRFGLICGTGILHHLDLHKAVPEIARILQPDGEAIFLEPLGHNPLINLYRRLTPRMRTADEHPLRMSDLRLVESYFRSFTAHYFNLHTILATPLLRLPGSRSLLFALETLDDVAFRVCRPLRKYAWIVVMQFAGPRS